MCAGDSRHACGAPYIPNDCSERGVSKVSLEYSPIAFLYPRICSPFFYVQSMLVEVLLAGCLGLLHFPAFCVMNTRRQARLRQERRRAQAVDRHSRLEHSRQSFCRGASDMSGIFNKRRFASKAAPAAAY